MGWGRGVGGGGKAVVVVVVGGGVIATDYKDPSLLLTRRRRHFKCCAANKQHHKHGFIIGVIVTQTRSARQHAKMGHAEAMHVQLALSLSKEGRKKGRLLPGQWSSVSLECQLSCHGPASPM